MIFIPFAPFCIDLLAAILAALLYDIRLSICSAIELDTNVAFKSGFRISSIFNCVLFFVISDINFFNSSILCPPRPITIPGRDVKILTDTSLVLLSISILVIPASLLTFIILFRILWSSLTKLLYENLFPYHVESQPLEIPNLKPIGCIFCPINIFSFIQKV